MVGQKARFFRLIIAICLSLSALQAFAQFGMAAPGSLDVKYNPALLMNPVVQKELAMSPEITQKVMSAMMSEGMKLMPLMQKQGGGSSAEFAAKAAAAYRVMEKETTKHLTPKQRTRLAQLTLQSLGASAIMNPRVAKELGLTADQRKKIDPALSEVARKSMAGMKPPAAGGNGDVRAMMSDMAKRQDEAKAAAEKVLKSNLTPAQIKKWDAMLGKRVALTGLAGMGNPFGGR